MTTLTFELETAPESSLGPIDNDGKWVYNGQITEEGVNFLIDLFRKPRSIAELTAYLDQVQELEDAVWALKAAFSLEDAVGVQLDAIGALFAEPRLARSDDNYRASIRARRLAQRSNGKPEELITIVFQLSPTDTQVILTDARMENTINIIRSGAKDATSSTIARILQLAHAGGTKLNIAMGDDGASTLLFGADDTVAASDVGLGSDATNTYGGLQGYDAQP